MKKSILKKVVAILSVMVVTTTSLVMAAVSLVPEFSKSKISMKVGATQSVNTLMNIDSVDLTKLNSSDSSVVLIDSTGKIKALSTGISTLTYNYTEDDGTPKQAYCYVEVTRDNSTYEGVNGETTHSKILVTLDLGDYTTTVESAIGAIFNPQEVTKAGFVLEGWYKEPTYQTKLNVNERLSKDITLYAKWITEEESNKPNVPHSSLFDDIDYHWARNYIESVSYRGLFNGVSEKMFGPDKTMTRAMVITVLGRLDEVTKIGRTTEFVDVPQGSYYEEYVAWGLENKIISGTSENKFLPNKEITREEMAVMMANYVKYKGYDYELNELYFSDVDSISSWALESVKILNDLKIMQGNSDGTYNPKKVATRAEIATVFYNYLNFMNRG